MNKMIIIQDFRKAVFIVVLGVVLQQRNPKHDDKLFKSNRVNCINHSINIHLNI